jgi:hypothetical protein
MYRFVGLTVVFAKKWSLYNTLLFDTQFNTLYYATYNANFYARIYHVLLAGSSIRYTVEPSDV